MYHPLLAVHHDTVAIQRVIGDPRRVHDQRDRKRPRDDCGVAANRSSFKDDPAQGPAIFQQFRRTDIARDQNGVHRHLCTGV